MKPFVTDDDVLNHISDDMIYIRELVDSERIKGPDHLNVLKQAHLGRLVVVFINNAMEAHRDLVARAVGIAKRDCTWEAFFNSPILEPYFKRVISTSGIPFEFIDEALDFVVGIKELRNMIAHGLTDETANNFQAKVSRMQRAGFLKNPMKISITDIECVLKTEQAVTSLIGMARALRTHEMR